MWITRCLLVGEWPVDNYLRAGGEPVDSVDNTVDKSVDNFLVLTIQYNHIVLVVINRVINMWITCVIEIRRLCLNRIPDNIVTCVRKKGYIRP